MGSTRLLHMVRDVVWKSGFLREGHPPGSSWEGGIADGCLVLKTRCLFLAVITDQSSTRNEDFET